MEQNDKKEKLKKYALVGGLVLCVIALILLMFGGRKEYKALSIANFDEFPQFSDGDKKVINSAVDRFITANFSDEEKKKILEKNDIYIRAESVNDTTINDVVHEKVFLIDSDTIHSTYEISFMQPLTEIEGENPVIHCPSKKQRKYPDVECRGASVKIPDIYYDLPFKYIDYDEDYNYTEYVVKADSTRDCNDDYCVKIVDVTGGNYENALELIRENGYNPDDYTIIYKYEPIN